MVAALDKEARMIPILDLKAQYGSIKDEINTADEKNGKVKGDGVEVENESDGFFNPPKGD